MLHYFKRRSPGGKPVDGSHYEKARHAAFKVGRYSTALRRELPSREVQVSLGLATSTMGTWEFLGPDNIGGRTRALFVHSNGSLLYAAGVAGGVFRSTDTGASWVWTEAEQIPSPTSSLPNLAVSSILVQTAEEPGVDDTVIVGTGEGFFVVDAVRGDGVFKSTNARQTWVRITSPSQQDPENFYYVNDLIQSTSSTSRYYAATRTGVWRYDGGETWTQIYDASTVRGGVTELAIRQDSAGRDEVFAAVGMNSPWACGDALTVADSNVIRILNADQTTPYVLTFTLNSPFQGWKRGRISLARSGNYLYALVSRRPDHDCEGTEWGLYGLYRVNYTTSSTFNALATGKDDEPLTERLLLSNPACGYEGESQGWYDNALAVDPVGGGSKIWVGGVGLFRSTDTGSTWGLASDWKAYGESPYVHEDQHAISFGDGTNAIFVAGDGGIFYSADRTSSTVPVCGTTPTPTPTPPTPTPTPTPTIGIQWSSRNQSYSTVQFYHGVAWSSGSEYYGGTQDNSVLARASGDGKPWELPGNRPGGDCGYGVVAGSTRWIAGKRRDFMRMSDGLTRSPAETPTTNYHFITPFVGDPSDDKRVWSGGRFAWRCTNLDQDTPTWTQASSSQWAASVSAIGVSPEDGNIVMMGRVRQDDESGTDSGLIARTQNGLNVSPSPTPTWSDGDTPRNGWVSWIAMDPDACSSLGSCVGYATYSSLGGDHVFRTTNGGSDWESIDSDLPDIPVHCIVVDPTSPQESGRRQRLYLGTDLGVWVSLNGGSSWLHENTGFPDVPVESMSISYSEGDPNYLFAFTHGRGAYRVPLCSSAPAYPTPTPTGTRRVNQSRCDSGTPQMTEYSLYYRSANMPTPTATPSPNWNMRTELAEQSALLDGFLLYPEGFPECGATTRQVLVNLTPAPTPAPGRSAENVLLGAGDSSVTLRFANDYGSQDIPTTFRVTRQGDVDLDGDVDVSDNQVMQAALVGNAEPEETPFNGDISLAETAQSEGDYDGELNLFDVVRHASFIVGNITCITPPMSSQGSYRVTPSVQGSARLMVTAARLAGKSGGSVDLLVSVDVTGVSVSGVPLGVGGYKLRATFDPRAVTLAAVSPTSPSRFPEPPIFTNLPAANAAGRMRVVGALSERIGALGLVPLCVIRVQERLPGAASQVAIVIEELASGLTDDGVLPIPVSSPTVK